MQRLGGAGNPEKGLAPDQKVQGGGSSYQAQNLCRDLDRLWNKWRPRDWIGDG